MIYHLYFHSLNAEKIKFTLFNSALGKYLFELQLIEL